jgi:hypothetical protein
MVLSPVGRGTENHCAGEGQQQFSRQLVIFPPSDWQNPQEIIRVGPTHFAPWQLYGQFPLSGARKLI